MATLDELTFKAELKDEVTAPLRKVRAEFDATAKSVSQIGGPTHQRQVKALSGNLNDLHQVAGKANASLNKMSASLASLTGRGLRDAAVGLGAISAAATGFGLKASASFEQSRIQFGTLLGSVQQGNDLFARLQKFNLETPFNLTQISQATGLLLNGGIAGDQVMNTLKTITDVAATSGPQAAQNLGAIALAISQINQAGVAHAQDLNQLVNAGFPAYQLLAQVSGKTTAQLRKDMDSGLTVPATQFMDAINGEMGLLQKYAGGAKAQAETLSGVWSNFTDTLQTRLSTAFDPLAKGLKQSLPELTTQLGAFIDSTAPALSSFVQQLIGVASTALPILAPVVNALLTGIGQLLAAAAPGLAMLQPVMGELGQAIGEMVTALVPVMPDVVAAFVALVGVLPDVVRLLTAFVPLIPPVAHLVETLASMHGVLAPLLVGLLAYRAVAGLVGGVMAFAGGVEALAVAYRNLAGAEVAEAAARTAGGGVPGGGGLPIPSGTTSKGGKLASVGRTLAPIAGFGLLGMGNGNDSILGDAEKIGGGALVGSMFGLPGAVVGGAAMGGLVLGRRIWDATHDPVRRPGINPDSGTIITPYGQRIPPISPGVPNFAAANQVSNTVNVAPGGITVYNPTSNVDIINALEDYTRQQQRRGARNSPFNP